MKRWKVKTVGRATEVYEVEAASEDEARDLRMKGEADIISAEVDGMEIDTVEEVAP